MVYRVIGQVGIGDVVSGTALKAGDFVTPTCSSCAAKVEKSLYLNRNLGTSGAVKTTVTS